MPRKTRTSICICLQRSRCSIREIPCSSEGEKGQYKQYKAICDNNSKTGRGRETFEFYDIIDEFMGCSDKVRPKYVRETNIGNANEHCSSPATILEGNASPDYESVDQQGATVTLPAS